MLTELTVVNYALATKNCQQMTFYIMDPYLSKSEKKRRAKGVEKLCSELVGLSENDIKKLPCDDFLKEEIKSVKGLKTGAKKRQTKFITKCLRKMDISPLLDFLQEQKGSKLKENKSFHEIERFRDDIITEVIEAMRQADHFGEKLDSSWKSEMIAIALERFPNLDTPALTLAALKYSRSRKPSFSREIFRILKAAMEHQRISQS